MRAVELKVKLTESRRLQILCFEGCRVNSLNVGVEWGLGSFSSAPYLLPLSRKV